MPDVPARGVISRLVVLDGLRGAAMSLVVLGHLWPGWVKPYFISVIPRGGSLALGLFFFISGFGIFYLFARATVDGGKEQSVRDFVIRRMGKILPSYYLCMVAVIALGWTNHDPGLAPLGFQIFTHAIFIHNWFPQTLFGIDGVMWSLAVECQFYLFFGLTRKLAVRWPVAYTATLIAISFAYRCFARSVYPHGNDWLDDQLPAILDAFGFGMLTAYLYRFIAKNYPAITRRRRLWTGIALATTACIYGDMYVNVASIIDPRFPVPLQPFLGTFDGILFSTIALSSIFAVDAWRDLVGNRPFVFIGAISYNVYLYHQVLFLQMLGRFGQHMGRLERGGLALVTVAITVAIAAFLKRYYEQPIVDYLRRFETGHSDRVAAATVDVPALPVLSNLLHPRSPAE